MLQAAVPVFGLALRPLLLQPCSFRSLTPGQLLQHWLAYPYSLYLECLPTLKTSLCLLQE